MRGIHLLTPNSEPNKYNMEIVINNPELAPVARARTYSTQEWDEKRPLITQLYRDEERSLNHVRAVLAQQEFRPT